MTKRRKSGIFFEYFYDRELFSYFIPSAEPLGHNETVEAELKIFCFLEFENKVFYLFLY